MIFQIILLSFGFFAVGYTIFCIFITENVSMINVGILLLATLGGFILVPIYLALIDCCTEEVKNE